MNAKITKGSKVWRRARSCGRWGVWVCTGLMIGAIPVSIWVGLVVSVEFVPEHGSTAQRRMVKVYFVDGVLIGQYYPQYKQMSFSAPEPGWSMSIEQGTLFWPFPVKRWRPSFSQGGGSGGTSYNTQVPIVYPAAVMVVWSLWLVRGRQKLRWGIGCCEECGYSLAGLSGGVCPECGERYA